jgi:hypothetical protein
MFQDKLLFPFSRVKQPSLPVLKRLIFSAQYHTVNWKPFLCTQISKPIWLFTYLNFNTYRPATIYISPVSCKITSIQSAFNLNATPLTHKLLTHEEPSTYICQRPYGPKPPLTHCSSNQHLTWLSRFKIYRTMKKIPLNYFPTKTTI